MKRTTRKLALRPETVRVLSGPELVQARGGRAYDTDTVTWIGCPSQKDTCSGETCDCDTDTSLTQPPPPPP